jgi:dipeptide/tripeptide permease
VDEKFGLAVLDAAAGFAVLAVLIRFAGKTDETPVIVLAIKPPRKVVES